MTRTRLIALSALTALTVAACGSQGDSGHANGAAKVVTTTNVWSSVATAVTGGHADVKALLTSDVDDPHSYEATPADAAAIADASLVVINGGGYDHWADDVLKNHKNVTTVDAYSLLPHNAPGEANEHVFYNMAVAKAVAAKIADDLAKSDSANADASRANASEFGLAAFLFSDDLNRAMRVGRAIESGIVGINSGLISNAANPFGGVKQSGFGREGSTYGIDDYLQAKALTLALR